MSLRLGLQSTKRSWNVTTFVRQPFVCIAASAAEQLARPGPKETLPLPDRSAATFDSALPCRCNLSTESSDRQNRVGMDSCLEQPAQERNDKAANDPIRQLAFADASPWPYRFHARCIGCRR